ncbi:hypothetical protein JCM19294_534 [Nonlabens tegetincola]|uniref:Uncharacterized protein n=1 Tax=Nonlabens tegetincola TaxID=323273 RepID=A0A090Q5M2_9FLAO|nr:hypothetical protein [Nonlabens tegetincola]GAK97028.1 hypothetical protein JCM19294_534 [Nonlabens tegetincola]
MFKQTDASLFYYQNRQPLLDIFIVSNFMFATYLNIPNYILLPTLLLSIWWLFDFRKSIKSLSGLGILTLFSCISFYSYRFDFSQLDRIDDFIPVSALFFLSVSLAISPYVKRSTMKLFCYFFILEIVLALVLFLTGNENVSGLMLNVKNLADYEYELPLRGVHVLSDSATVFGLNSFVLLILNHQFFKNHKFYHLFLVLGILGVVLSGSKYMIFILLPFFLFKYLLRRKIGFSKITLLVISVLLLFVICLVMLTSLSFLNVLTSQRLSIFYNFYKFLCENFWLGNNSMDLRMSTSSGKQYHAHNSFIQVIATNGFIYFNFLAILIAKKLIGITTLVFFSSFY